MATKKKKNAAKPTAKPQPKARVAAPAKSKPIANLQGEVWKKVLGSDRDYRISNKGRVKSYFYDTENGKLIKGKNVNGYLACDMIMKKGRKLMYIHSLVASHFVKKPSPKHIRVVHLDWKKTNNNAANLKFVTQKESYDRNAEYNAKKFAADRSVNAKLTVDKVKDLKKQLKAGKTQSSMAKKLKVSLMTISRIATGKSWVNIK